MIYYERMKYTEHVGVLSFLYFLKSKSGKIAAFSIHSNEFNMSGNVFIIVSPLLPPSVMFRSAVAHSYGIRLETEQ